MFPKYKKVIAIFTYASSKDGVTFQTGTLPGSDNEEFMHQVFQNELRSDDGHCILNEQVVLIMAVTSKHLEHD